MEKIIIRYKLNFNANGLLYYYISNYHLKKLISYNNHYNYNMV